MTGRHVPACRCIWCASNPRNATVSDDDLYLDAIFQADRVRFTINTVIHNRAHLGNTQLHLSSKNLIQRLETVINRARTKETEPEELVEEIDRVHEDFVNLFLN